MRTRSTSTTWRLRCWTIPCDIYAGAAVVLMNLAVLTTHAYPQGAPPEACRDLYPWGHLVDPMPDVNPPFIVFPSTDKYIPGNPIKVTILGNRHFLGFMLQARRPGKETPQGRWLDLHPGVQTINCYANADTATHSGAERKHSVTLQWLPVADSMADGVHFVATVVENKQYFWTNVSSAIIYKGTPDVARGVDDVTSQHPDVVLLRQKRDAEEVTTVPPPGDVTSRRPINTTISALQYDFPNTTGEYNSTVGKKPRDNMESWLNVAIIAGCYIGMYTGFSLLLI